METCTNFADHFDDRGGLLVRNLVHCPMDEVHEFTRSIQTHFDNIHLTCIYMYFVFFFHCQHVEMGAKQKDGPQ